MIPDINFIITNLQQTETVKVGGFVFPILVDILAKSDCPFRVVSASLKRINNKNRIKIAELDKFDGDDIYWEDLNREFNLSDKTENKNMHNWKIILSSQIIKSGINNLDFQLNLQLI